MEQIHVKAKRWGNSYAIILPKRVAQKENIKTGSDLVISLRTKESMTVGDLMALSKKRKWDKLIEGIDTQKAMRQVDEVFWPD